MVDLDFKKLNESLVQIVQQLCQEWMPDGKKSGHNWNALCPFRSDKNRGSFKVDLRNGVFKDFSSGEGGDLIELYSKIESISHSDAAKHLSDKYLGKSFDEIKSKEPKLDLDNDDFNILIAPKEANDRELWHWQYKKQPEEKYLYKGLNGEIIGYVCRFEDGKDLKTGKIKKQTWPRTFCENKKTGEKKWKWKGFEKPRPLYNLNILAKNPDKYVLLVEGEKCAKAANSVLFETVVAMAWPAGTNSLPMVDFSPLKGKKVIYWPDNDAPGLKCAKDIINYLTAIVDDLRLIIPNSKWPESYDIADAIEKGATAEVLEKFIRENIKDSKEFFSYLDRPVGVPSDFEETIPLPDPPQEMSIGEAVFDVDESFDFDDFSFRMLGINNGTYYYFSYSTGNVIDLRANEHRSHSLLPLACLNWWTKRFPSKTGVDWLAAANYLMNSCSKKIL